MYVNKKNTELSSINKKTNLYTNYLTIDKIQIKNVLKKISNTTNYFLMQK